MPNFRIHVAAVLLAVLPVLAIRTSPQTAQGFTKMELDRSRQMLRDAYDNVKKYYYDPTFHGIDLDARYHKSDEEMRGAASLGDAFSIIADFLGGLNDSHTFFRPPVRPLRVEYGYRLQMVGDKTFISRIRPGTDAESKVHPGDQVISLNRFKITRDAFWRLDYIMNALSPLPATQLALRDPVGTDRQVNVNSKMQQLKHTLDLSGDHADADFWRLVIEEQNEDHQSRQRYTEPGDVMIWKMPEFELEDGEVDHLFGIARKHSALVLDLRGNHGGAVDTLTRMVGNIFDHDVKIGDRTGRKEQKPLLAKTVGGKAFSGKLIVLVDSESASASELFARVVQLEGRGGVLGDVSSGRVMESVGHSCHQGADTMLFYGFSVTEANITMKDGKSLEHSGVTPDEIILPTAEDIAKDRDPVLVRAAELAGLKLDPVAAGKMFPYEWLPF